MPTLRRSSFGRSWALWRTPSAHYRRPSSFGRRSAPPAARLPVIVLELGQTQCLTRYLAVFRAPRSIAHPLHSLAPARFSPLLLVPLRCSTAVAGVRQGRRPLARRRRPPERRRAVPRGAGAARGNSGRPGAAVVMRFQRGAAAAGRGSGGANNDAGGGAGERQW